MADSVTTTTGLGDVRGINAHGVERYLGIRFAEPPTGDRRFRPPVRSGSWDGVYDATAFGNRSMQPPMAQIFGPPGPGENDEDCLFLNVFTPAADGARRPVLCWIHGGSYTTGSGNDYDGSILAGQGDAVIVTVNYRLGVLGFLDLSGQGDEYAGSASNGLRDQITALEWIRDHIADFGGDPDNVTIFGESAGGGSVLALVAAPAADGLFHKVISHSPGGVNTPPADQTPAIDIHLGGDGALIDRLRAAPAERLIEIQAAVSFTGGDIDGTVVTRHPVDAIRDRGASGPPLLIGTNRDEGTLFSAIMSPIPGLFEAITDHIAIQVTRGDDSAPYLAAIKAAYPDDDGKTLGERVWVDLFRRTAVDAAEAATASGKGGWLYRFDVPTNVFGGVLGATHACEIAFTFNWLAGPADMGLCMHDRSNPALQGLARQWSDAVLAFARSADPNTDAMPEWPRYDGESGRACMMLDTPVRVENDPDGAHRDLWVLNESANV